MVAAYDGATCRAMENQPQRGGALSSKKEEDATKEAFNSTAFAQFLFGPGGRQAGAVFLTFGVPRNDRRNKAIAALQAANPQLVVSYTLSVNVTGLPQPEINLLQNAMQNGVNIRVVNIMVMDYYSAPFLLKERISSGKARANLNSRPNAQIVVLLVENSG
jgi:hypothetical protein